MEKTIKIKKIIDPSSDIKPDTYFFYEIHDGHYWIIKDVDSESAKIFNDTSGRNWAAHDSEFAKIFNDISCRNWVEHDSYKLSIQDIINMTIIEMLNKLPITPKGKDK